MGNEWKIDVLGREMVHNWVKKVGNYIFDASIGMYWYA